VRWSAPSALTKHDHMEIDMATSTVAASLGADNPRGWPQVMRELAALRADRPHDRRRYFEKLDEFVTTPPPDIKALATAALPVAGR
jgi:hypothetical protein